MTDRKWLKLNSHGKYCLEAFLCAISASDLLSTQLYYLHDRDLVGRSDEYKDYKEREPISNYCLTDLGLETAKHYFPNYKNW